MRLFGSSLLAAAVLVAGSTASAQEIVKTGPDGPPLAAVADPEQPPQLIERWSRGFAGPSPEAGPVAAAGGPSRCAPPPDRQPHGEVWAGIGTGGYREAGGVVTKPLGDCGSVSVAIDHMSSDGLRRH